MRFNKPEVTAQELATLLKSPNPPRLLDIREQPEWELAHIAGTQPLTQALMDEALGSWDKASPVVTICHHGVRSLNMAGFLKKQGFTDVRSMKGGMEAWSLDVDPAVPRY